MPNTWLDLDQVMTLVRNLQKIGSALVSPSLLPANSTST